MTEKEILKKAIGKAIKNGWDILKFVKAEKWKVQKDSVGLQIEAIYSCSNPTCLHRVYYNAEKVIFDHSFAKCFWGGESFFYVKYMPDETTKDGWTEQKLIMVWQYHLQQMVLEKNPIQYLAKFLEKKGKG